MMSSIVFSPRDFLQNPKEYVQNIREYRKSRLDMKPYDEVFLDSDSYFNKVAQVLKRQRSKGLVVVINPYESACNDTVTSLRKACTSNQSITHLTIQIGSRELASFEFRNYEASDVAWKKSQIHKLSSSLLSLPCLTHLKIDFSHLVVDEEGGEPFLEVFQALPKAKSLKNLTVNEYELHLSDDNYNLVTSKVGPLAKLCQPLQHNLSLEQITLNLQSDNLPRESPAALIVMSFQSLPKLKSLEITDQARFASGQAHLTCGGKDLQEILQANTGLESLKLWLAYYANNNTCWKDEENLLHVGRGLEANTSLQTLKVGTDPTACAISGHAAKQLDETEHTEDTEEMISNEFSFPDYASEIQERDDEFLNPAWGRIKCQPKPQQELLRVFERGQNYELRELSLFDIVLPAKVAVYLQLNGTGRKHLLDSNAGPEQWMSHIVSKQSQLSLDATFELLRMNPAALLSTEAKRPKKKAKTWRKRVAKAMWRQKGNSLAAGL
ncbi:unknown protein [Seminavis robusta]|uniref:Uncharacterized protein n=1 Tax=Seminavis robusta TaxID=568900 RepID=A0A9N8DBP4_9STRA|nr:unknown protein [Seminavis robusta]|eukprot:Sro48_g028260.1 n/a (496) ;mRNA; f:75271-76758